MTLCGDSHRYARNRMSPSDSPDGWRDSWAHGLPNALCVRFHRGVCVRVLLLCSRLGGEVCRGFHYVASGGIDGKFVVIVAYHVIKSGTAA